MRGKGEREAMRRFRPASILALAAALLGLVLLNGYYAAPVQSQVTEITELEEIVRALDESIKASQSKMERLAAQIEATQQQMKQTEAELDAAETRLEENRRLFGTRVRSAYLNGGISYLEIILDADNFGDLLVRAAYLERILNRDAGLIASIKHERALIEEKKRILEEQHSQLLALMEQEKAEHNTLLAQKREKEKLLREAVEKTAGYKPVYGVVIDNHSRARPQSGLALASVVYEFEVEGRITRYLALFSVFPTKVGPIRSARTHSIQLALENDVHYIYAGGSSDIVAAINNTPGLRHTNADNPSLPGHIRTTDRKPPHNLYINLAKLGKEPPSRVVEVRPAYLDRQGEPCHTVSLEYNSVTRIKYQYRPATRDYLRYLNGEVHRDASGKEISARNIIIQYAPHYIDFRGRPTPNLIGSGPIDFYSMGQHFRGTWRKDSPAAKTRFYYEDGTEIEMVYGRTWIQIVRPR